MMGCDSFLSCQFSELDLIAGAILSKGSPQHAGVPSNSVPNLEVVYNDTSHNGIENADIKKIPSPPQYMQHILIIRSSRSSGRDKPKQQCEESTSWRRIAICSLWRMAPGGPNRLKFGR